MSSDFQLASDRRVIRSVKVMARNGSDIYEITDVLSDRYDRSREEIEQMIIDLDNKDELEIEGTEVVLKKKPSMIKVSDKVSDLEDVLDLQKSARNILDYGDEDEIEELEKAIVNEIQDRNRVKRGLSYEIEMLRNLLTMCDPDEQNQLESLKGSADL